MNRVEVSQLDYENNKFKKGAKYMTMEEIKEKLARKAVTFQTGGIRPTKELLESWIGCVRWKKPGEGIPNDKNGNEMIPIATLFIKDLPYIPEHLQTRDYLSS